MNDDDTITLNVSITPEDHAAWFACYLDRSAHARATVRKWQWFLGLLGGVFPAIAGIVLMSVCCNWGWIAVGYGVLYLGYVLTGFPPRYRKRWTRKYLNMMNEESPEAFGPCAIALREDEIVSTTKTAALSIALTRITDIVDMPDYKFLVVGQTNAIIIPKRDVSSEQRSVFESALRERMQVA